MTHPAFIWVNALTIGLLGLIGFYARASSKTYRFYLLFRDPYVGGPFYQSLFTNFSEVMWCIALGICLFCFGIMRSLNRRYDWFFLATAGIIAMLLLDDLQRITLVLHYTMGVPKAVMYGLYMGVIGAYSWIFRRRLVRETPFPLLLITVGLFVFSALADVSGYERRKPGTFAMLEDGTKLLGLMNLVLYCWLVGQQEIKRTMRRLSA
ncbi:MAG: hypothetical protein HC824_13575 [Synechococcales cyanobacterium RM1_1_8]|nr:hypothetical protein [Synechococcales cyanobacterium RM1_1_8]